MVDGVVSCARSRDCLLGQAKVTDSDPRDVLDPECRDSDGHRALTTESTAAAVGTAAVQGLEKGVYLARLSRVSDVAATASSPADAMSLAPVRSRMAFARVISSDVSQCTDSRTPPSFTRPS